MVTCDYLAGMVDDTLADLWACGEEFTVTTLVYHLNQLTSQVDTDDDDNEVYTRVSMVIQPYLRAACLTTELPSPYWRDWLNNLVRGLRYVRMRRGAFRETNLNHGGPNARHPNANMRPDSAGDATSLMAKHRPVAKAKGAPAKTIKPGKPRHSLHAPLASLTHSWAGEVRRRGPALPKTRWLRNPPPWRSASSHLRRRTNPHANVPKAGAVCGAPSGDRASSSRDANNPRLSKSRTPTSATTEEPPPEHEDNETFFDDEFAEEAASTWRRLLGMDHGKHKGRAADSSTVDGGLTNDQRHAIAEHTQGMTPAVRGRFLASLGFFLSTVLMDASVFIHELDARPSLLDDDGDRPGHHDDQADVAGLAGDDGDQLHDNREGECQEEEVPVEENDHAMMQTSRTSRGPQIHYSAFTLLLSSPLEEVFEDSQQAVASHFLQEATTWTPNDESALLLAHASCPLAKRDIARLPVLDHREQLWFRTWLPIIRKHLRTRL